MRFQTIHLPESNLATSSTKLISHRNQIENIIVVKEGFGWPAFFFNVLWAMYHKLWKTAFLLVLTNLLLSITLFQLGADRVAYMLSFVGVATIFGYLANDFRRSKLNTVGYREQCIIMAPTKNSAVQRFLNVFIIRR